MTQMRMTPIDDASIWRGADLEREETWRYTLNAAHRAELAEALAAVKAREMPLAEIAAADFPLPRVTVLLARVADELRDGRGFALLQGFPVEDYSFEDLELMYWGLCSHVGTGISQNSDGGLIHYVTEGPRRPRQGKRGVGFPQEAPLHVDLMDVVSLLCVRQAPDDPPSWVASSMTVYNEILRRKPSMLDRLYAGFEWDRMDEHGVDELPSTGYRVPLFSQTDGIVSCRYNRHWIVSAYERSQRSLSRDEKDALEFFDAVAHEARFAFSFGAGDIQFCNNYTVLHGRAAHRVEPDMARRRVLMRIWLDLPDIRKFSDESIVRYGIGRHGQLGWTAADMLTHRDRRPRQRRADGAPLLT